jgi:capsular polysaccharide biosynthesis protein
VADILPPRPTLVPAVTQSFQRVLLGMLGAAAEGFVPLGPTSCVAVDHLVYVPSLTAHGFATHPLLRHAFDRLSAAVPDRGAPPKRIYISRGPTGNRPLENEAEVIAIVAAAGFKALSLDRMPVPDQIRCFRGATHVVAPHGAGLANIMFAAAAPRLLELQMDEYIHWCFRRLSGLRNCTYGCVVGESRRVSSWPHANSWRLPPEALRQALASPAFLAP